jgi:hypothetical protein
LSSSTRLSYNNFDKCETYEIQNLYSTLWNRRLKINGQVAILDCRVGLDKSPLYSPFNKGGEIMDTGFRRYGKTWRTALLQSQFLHTYMFCVSSIQVEE